MGHVGNRAGMVEHITNPKQTTGKGHNLIAIGHKTALSRAMFK
jgi:hypothetical protein